MSNDGWTVPAVLLAATALMTASQDWQAPEPSIMATDTGHVHSGSDRPFVAECSPNCSGFGYNEDGIDECDCKIIVYREN